MTKSFLNIRIGMTKAAAQEIGEYAEPLGRAIAEKIETMKIDDKYPKEGHVGIDISINIDNGRKIIEVKDHPNIKIQCGLAKWS